MRRKIGTALDAGLYQRARDLARRQGVRTNVVIEDALRRYLAGHLDGASAVAETRGTYKVPRRALRLVLQDDLYGPE